MILLVWFIWTEKPGRPQSKGSQRIGHNSATEHAHGGFQYTPVIDKRHILLATFFCQCLHKKMDACLQNLTKKKKNLTKQLVSTFLSYILNTTGIIQTSIQTIGKVARPKTHYENLICSVGILCYFHLSWQISIVSFIIRSYFSLLLHNKCPSKVE